MLFKVTVDAYDGYDSSIFPGETGEMVLNTNRIKRFWDAGSSKTNVVYVKNPQDRNDQGHILLLDETYANIKTFIKTVVYEYLTLPFFPTLNTSGTTSTYNILTEDFIRAIEVDTDTTSQVEYNEGGFKKEVKFVDLNLDEIAEMSTDGTVFETFNFLADDNAALTVDVTGVIDHAAKTIALDVPAATVVTALVASFTIEGDSGVFVGATPQVSGTTANDFTAAVDYLLKEGSTTYATYEVTVTILP